MKGNQKIKKDSKSQVRHSKQANKKEVKQQSIVNTNATPQTLEDLEESLSQLPTLQTKRRTNKYRRYKDFTLCQDQKILKLILKFGPKFKRISRLLNGKPINIVKNRYYRLLRYRWDEILGRQIMLYILCEYAFLNENEEKISLDNIFQNPPIAPELSNIMADLMKNIQNSIQQYLG